MEYQPGKYIAAAARDDYSYFECLARERDKDRKLKRVREIPTEETVEELYKEVFADENRG